MSLLSPKIKICGISTPDAMTAALDGGADFVGLVFHHASPRCVDTDVAAYLASYIPEHVQIVGLFVDPDDARLKEVAGMVRIDMIQLHGQESVERVREVRKLLSKPVMKALPISSPDDLSGIDRYAEVADWLLLDAKGNDTMPGGNGAAFDWLLLDGFVSPVPWMLAGGLTPDNVRQAVFQLRPDGVDVSSGVESSRGVKDPDKIRAFLNAARHGRTNS